MPSEPKFLEVFSSLNEGRFPAGAEISVGSSQFAREVCFGQNRNSRRNIPMCGCEAFFGQTLNSWRYLPIWMRGVFPVRTQIPGDISQFKLEVLFSQN